ncbi:MAG: glutamate 5-kinase [Pseudomonadota bacterium]
MAALNNARRIVVKIGSALLVGEDGLRTDWIDALAEDVAWLRGEGVDVVLVSSGSIALGRRSLALGAGALPLEQSQAAAAVGQIRLARAYETALVPHGIVTAQILLTLDDSEDRRRYLNARATLEQLLALGTVPVVNENDTIATDEIRFGDNDRLAAQIAATVGADLLVLLSDVDGLYSGNPRMDPEARHIGEVTEITPEIETMAGDAGTGAAKGGMKTKLIAARAAMRAGAVMAIAEGTGLNPLRALDGGARATWFRPKTDPAKARKSWIASMKPRGKVTVDDGAAGALRAGKSLLPAGVRGVSGAFGRGDPVAILGADGTRLAIGLSRYTADEAVRVAGRRTGEIAEILGHPGRSVLVHRDDMAL